MIEGFLFLLSVGGIMSIFFLIFICIISKKKEIHNLKQKFEVLYVKKYHSMWSIHIWTMGKNH